jgi:hypothetical protein
MKQRKMRITATLSIEDAAAVLVTIANSRSFDEENVDVWTIDINTENEP